MDYAIVGRLRQLLERVEDERQNIMKERPSSDDFGTLSVALSLALEESERLRQYWNTGVDAKHLAVALDVREMAVAAHALLTVAKGNPWTFDDASAWRRNQQAAWYVGDEINRRIPFADRLSVAP